jgi:hypothetical protein
MATLRVDILWIPLRCRTMRGPGSHSSGNAVISIRCSRIFVRTSRSCTIARLPEAANSVAAEHPSRSSENPRKNPRLDQAAFATPDAVQVLTLSFARHPRSSAHGGCQSLPSTAAEARPCTLTAEPGHRSYPGKDRLNRDVVVGAVTGLSVTERDGAIRLRITKRICKVRKRLCTWSASRAASIQRVAFHRHPPY